MVETNAYFSVASFANTDESSVSNFSEKHVDSSERLFRKPSLESDDDIQQNTSSVSYADVEATSFHAEIMSARENDSLSKTSLTTNHKDYAIVRFSYPDPEKPVHNKICNIELPLQITSNDLIVGLESAYHLGIDLSDMKQCYLSCEYPIALLKGNRTLAECGVRDGSLISFKRR